MALSLYLSQSLCRQIPSTSTPTSRERARARGRSCSAASYNPKVRRPYTTVLIVPTGVGAFIGGFAGDALPVARALSTVADCVISHPMPNVLYVEGYALDMFAQGLWALQPVHQNKVGLVLDAAIEEDFRLRHLQVADATRASLGLPVIEHIVTDFPLKVETWFDPKCGNSTGRIKNPDSLFRAVNSLVNHTDVNAIAVVASFPDDDLDEFEIDRQGKGVDLLAGVEAIISHSIVQEFKLPAAHAPANLPFPPSASLSPKSAAEEIGYTFLPCVLAGLSSAPQYVTNPGSFVHGSLVAGDVDSVVLPADACGGNACLAFSRSNDGIRH